MTAPQSWLPFRMNQAVVYFMGFMYLYFVLPCFKKHAHTQNTKQKKWRLAKSTVHNVTI